MKQKQNYSSIKNKENVFCYSTKAKRRLLGLDVFQQQDVTVGDDFQSLWASTVTLIEQMHALGVESSNKL